MSLSTQTQRRLPTIKRHLLLGQSSQQIGECLGVTEKTIDRDIRAFIESGDFELWIKEEWIRLHNIIIHDNPEEAYRNITKLVSNMLTRRFKSEEIQYEEIKLVIDACPNNSPSQANTTHTPDKENSTEATADSAYSAVVDVGAKPKLEQTKSSSEPCNPQQNQSASA